jgi:hypothetical protein
LKDRYPLILDGSLPVKYLSEADDGSTTPELIDKISHFLVAMNLLSRGGYITSLDLNIPLCLIEPLHRPSPVLARISYLGQIVLLSLRVQRPNLDTGVNTRGGNKLAARREGDARHIVAVGINALLLTCLKVEDSHLVSI